jgi:uncharacterized protein
MESELGELKDRSGTGTLNMSFNLRWVCGLLVLVIVGMLIVWMPWRAGSLSSDRTITVTGEATVTAEPDKYVFIPSYEFAGSDKPAAITAMTKKSSELIADLKGLGVADKEIKSDSTSGGPLNYYSSVYRGGPGYTMQLTVTVGTRLTATKVQDYLLTTSPSGVVSPVVSFSEPRHKSLESQARDTATKDARSKAYQSGRNLGFRVGAVRSVQDGSGFGIMPYSSGQVQALDDKSASSSQIAPVPQTTLAVQPGQNDLSYLVTVVYFLR